MGKATIVSEQGGGEYVIKLDYDIDRLQPKKDKLQTEVTELDAEIIALETEYNVLTDEKNVLLDELDVLITAANSTADFFENEPEKVEELNKKAGEIAAINIEINDVNDSILTNKLSKVSKEKEISLLESAIVKYTDHNVSAWCADLTEELTGEVETIELNDETNKPNDNELNITPGGIVTSEKRVQPTIASGGPAVAYNIMSLAAFQKWKPRYRPAVISTIDKTANTCRITFNGEQEYSSSTGEFGKKFSLYQGTTLDDVPIEYMTCDAKAFEAGDNVIVMFSGEWSTPKVIGFIDNPKFCSQPFEIFTVSGEVTVTDEFTYPIEGKNIPVGDPPTLVDRYGGLVTAVDSEILNGQELSVLELRTSSGSVVGSITSTASYTINDDSDGTLGYQTDWRRSLNHTVIANITFNYNDETIVINGRNYRDYLDEGYYATEPVSCPITSSNRSDDINNILSIGVNEDGNMFYTYSLKILNALVETVTTGTITIVNGVEEDNITAVTVTNQPNRVGTTGGPASSFTRAGVQMLSPSSLPPLLQDPQFRSMPGMRGVTDGVYTIPA